MPGNRTPTDRPRTLQTSTTTLEVINSLIELNGATVTEMANHLDLSKGGAYNHLATLYENEYVVKEENRYDLSPRFVLMGEHVRHETLLYQFGREEVDKLVEETGEYAQLITEQHGYGIILYLAQGEKARKLVYPNEMKRNPLGLHHTAAGKAILAQLSESTVEQIIDEVGLRERTPNTITDRAQLHRELRDVREQGYATNLEEEVTGLKAIGAVISGSDGDVMGAVSLSGPKSRMQGTRFEEELPQKVMDVADDIEVNINMYQQSDTL
ncbi:MAG: IclR family transcriptional regulator [Halobacteriota archaeon]